MEGETEQKDAHTATQHAEDVDGGPSEVWIKLSSRQEKGSPFSEDGH